MAHELLSLKLGELDGRISRLSGRITLSELDDAERLEREADALERECAVSESALRRKLNRSQGGTAAVLARTYSDVARMIDAARAELSALAAPGDGEALAEEQALVAEYALDFALLAADRALLIAMRAIAGQKSLEPKHDKIERSNA